jgi:hypothetical protein
MSSKTLTIVFLIGFPILSLVIIFASLSLFSNFTPSNDFVYFQSQMAYSSGNPSVITIKDNKIQEMESPFYTNMKMQVESCKRSQSNSSAGSSVNYSSNTSVNNYSQVYPSMGDCDRIFNNANLTPIQDPNTPKPKIYLYQADKNISKEIDLPTAQKLTLIPEKQNDNGEIFSSDGCNYNRGLFPVYGGYSSGCSNSLTIKKSWQSKMLNLETSVYLNSDNMNYNVGYNSQQARNIYWVKKN